MSASQVIGNMAAVTGLIDTSLRCWKCIEQDANLPEAFAIIGDRLPLLHDTLMECQKHFVRVESSLPEHTIGAILLTMKRLKENTSKLKQIFQKTQSAEDDERLDTYRKLYQRFGKGSRVEELMKLVAEGIQDLVNFQNVDSQTLHRTLLEEIIARMRDVRPSLPEQHIPPGQSNTFRACQQNNYGGSNSQSYNHITGGSVHNFGPIAGNFTFNQPPN